MGEELIAMRMDLLMLKQCHVQSMEHGENGATGKLVQHPVMVELNRESVFVIVLSPNMVVMTAPQMAHLIQTFKSATRTDAQFAYTRVLSTPAWLIRECSPTKLILSMTVMKISLPKTRPILLADSLLLELSLTAMQVHAC